MIHLRLGKKTQKTGLGCRRVELSSKERAIRRQNRPLQRTRIRLISKKQRKRNKNLKDKREVLIGVQERLDGEVFCEARRGHENWKHRCPSLDGRHYDLVVDHVETRNGTDADRFENLQLLCSWCNFQKGSIRGLDFRSPEKKKSMLELDKAEQL